jgi:hypothetical protein
MENKQQRREIPTKFGALVFNGKALVFKAKRAAENFLETQHKRFSFDDKLKNSPLIGLALKSGPG